MTSVLFGAAVVTVCLLAPVVFASSPVATTNTKASDTIVFHYGPASGVYWNDKKLMDLPVPFFLHYYFRSGIPVSISVDGGNISWVEFFVGGALAFNATEPPFIFGVLGLKAYVPDHGSAVSPLVAKAYADGQVFVSENYTIYRLWL